jgi:hypothetical protein
MSLKGRAGFNVITGLDPVYPQRGPYEASEGIYPGRGQEKIGKSTISLIQIFSQTLF